MFSAGLPVCPMVRLAAGVLWLTTVSATACAPTGPQPLQIALVPAGSSSPATVRVSGLSSAEADALRTAGFTPAQWAALLAVTTGDGVGPAVAGRYDVVGQALEFRPAFPFDPGRPYEARFDPGRLPTPRTVDVVVAPLSLPGRPSSPRVRVSAIYPSTDVWPENLLRFYVHFSGPMARESGVGRVHLMDEAGVEVSDALLPASVDFWSPDQTRYTVLFDPGRVKRGIRPNLEKGRALVSGRRYTITVDAAWRDAEGRPLAERSQRTFTAGPAREAPLSMKTWRITTPVAGTREPLVLSVVEPLDHALLGRTVGLLSGGLPVDGVVDVRDGERVWHFTPAVAWRPDTYELVALSTLEDPAGNRIGRAFEVLPTDPAASTEAPERFSLPVVIR